MEGLITFSDGVQVVVTFKSGLAATKGGFRSMRVHADKSVAPELFYRAAECESNDARCTFTRSDDHHREEWTNCRLRIWSYPTGRGTLAVFELKAYHNDIKMECI